MSLLQRAPDCKEHQPGNVWVCPNCQQSVEGGVVFVTGISGSGAGEKIREVVALAESHGHSGEERSFNMKKTELLATSGIEFRSKASLPYGAELTVLQGASKVDNSLLVSVTNGVTRVERIETESQVLEGARLVVMSEASGDAGLFNYIAVPVERLDEEAERIESRILHAQPESMENLWRL